MSVYIPVYIVRCHCDIKVISLLCGKSIKFYVFTKLLALNMVSNLMAGATRPPRSNGGSSDWGSD